MYAQRPSVAPTLRSICLVTRTMVSASARIAMIVELLRIWSAFPVVRNAGSAATA
jgi:F0F1-type ATP synthase membrane subunit c/vacuolar-type H+-ATPase subunit K